MLKVRPHTKRKSGGGGGGGGGAVHFRSDIRKVRGGNSLQVRYEKWGEGGGGGPVRSRSNIRKVCVGGGGQVRYLCLAHRKYLHVYLPTCYLGIHHTRARMNVKYMHMPAKVNLLLFFCHPYVRGGVRPPRPPPP